MSDTAIRVENLGKQYHIGRQQARYKTIRETIVDGAKAPFRRAGRVVRGRGSAADLDETIWALKDVSFEVKQGDVVGVIGRNGAGKTTLLKILSRITEPTEGDAWIHGRVGSLLEVGTGFHPELTGRENVFLNGAILGMSKNEIDRKFDEIVDFAEIEKFIDTPVKHYSSGMYVRLAFSVAAFMEPEILLVDEVLAVGDAQFQKKCLGKMSDVAEGGRTILFVSHNMAAVNSLCSKGIILDSGLISCFDSIQRCVDKYLGEIERNIKRSTVNLPIRSNLPAQILESALVNRAGNLVSIHPLVEPFLIKTTVIVNKPISNTYLAIHIHDNHRETLLFSRNFESDISFLRRLDLGTYQYDVEIPGQLFAPGSFSVSVHLARSSPPRLLNGFDHALQFEVIDNSSIQAKMGFPWQGKLSIPLAWKVNKLP